MKDADLAFYRKQLVDKLRTLLGDVTKLEHEVSRSKKDSATLDISKFADIGTDAYEIEFDMGLLENQNEEIAEVVAALKRLEDRTFGTCSLCGKKIHKSRLKAIPYAKLCVACKKKEEENTGSADT